MVQYYFDGPVLDVKIKPHGNSKLSKPFFRTSETTKEHLKQLSSSRMPSEVVSLATSEQGGEVYAKSASCLPRDSTQIKNFRRSHKVASGVTDVLYAVMMECKLAQGKADSFIRDVKAAPEPMAVLFFDWQLQDLERFCTDNSNFTILCVDTTFNLGEFYVTPTVYRHLMLEDTEGRHPAIMGPILIHQQSKFSSFNYFFSTLISANKQLRNVLAVGTDGDEALVQAVQTNFPYAKQLRCFIILKRTLKRS